MKIFPSLEPGHRCFNRGWNLGGGFLAILLFSSGCASLVPVDDTPPVPVGPAGAAHMPAKMSVPPPVAFPGRSPGWDAPDTPGHVTPSPSAAVAMDEEFMKLQILMDRDNFSPGCIDGRAGNQSRMALRAWQKVRGYPVTGELDEVVRACVVTAGDLFTTHQVTPADRDGLAPVPKSWRAKAAVATMAHETVQERLAEQYHLSQRSLKELNPAAAWPNPDVGTVLRVPKIAPYPKTLAARIDIHLAGKYMQVFDYEGKMIAHFPCSIARDKEKRPVGELHIANAAENPNYTFKPELFAEDPEVSAIGRRLVIPPGPNNPVGVAWLSLDRPGYGIHGTPHPEDIGRTESHGCFRLSNWNARKVLGLVSIGIPVTVYE